MNGTRFKGDHSSGKSCHHDREKSEVRTDVDRHARPKMLFEEPMRLRLVDGRVETAPCWRKTKRFPVDRSSDSSTPGREVDDFVGERFQSWKRSRPW